MLTTLNAASRSMGTEHMEEKVAEAARHTSIEPAVTTCFFGTHTTNVSVQRTAKLQSKQTLNSWSPFRSHTLLSKRQTQRCNTSQWFLQFIFLTRKIYFSFFCLQVHYQTKLHNWQQPYILNYANIATNPSNPQSITMTSPHNITFCHHTYAAQLSYLKLYLHTF
jgi:hypothetical protein